MRPTEERIDALEREVTHGCPTLHPTTALELIVEIRAAWAERDELRSAVREYLAAAGEHDCYTLGQTVDEGRTWDRLAALVKEPKP